jgi:transposase
MDGISISQIALDLKRSKSTISIWTRDIKLTDIQKNKLKSRKRKNNSWNLKQKEESSKRASLFREKGYSLASKDYKFSIVCALYWGEGLKADTYFRISNCDWELIRLVFDWLVSYGVEEKIRFTVIRHKSSLSDNDIAKWWMGKLPGLVTVTIKSR